MRKSYFVLLCAILFSFIASNSPGVFAQEIDPAAGTFKLKKLPTVGFKEPLVGPGLVATGKNSLALFCGDIDNKTRLTDLKVVGLKSRGKVTTKGVKIKKGLFGDEGYASSAFWVGDYSSGYGIIFILYMVDENGKSFKLDAAMFNSKGELTGNFKMLFKLQQVKMKWCYLTV